MSGGLEVTSKPLRHVRPAGGAVGPFRAQVSGVSLEVATVPAPMEIDGHCCVLWRRVPAQARLGGGKGRARACPLGFSQLAMLKVL